MRASTSAVSVIHFVNHTGKPGWTGRIVRFAQHRLGFQDGRGLLAACTAITLIVVGQSSAFAADDSSRHFEIKAKPLADALMDFGVQSGLTIAAPTTLTADKTGATVRGDLPPRDALGRLLEGSGLTFTQAADGTIAIREIRASDSVQAGPEESPSEKDIAGGLRLDEIVVTAQKRTERLKDVPVSVGVQTAADLEKFHALQFNDYAGYIAGLNVVNGGWPGTNQVILRGLGQLGGDTPLVSIYVDDSPVNGSGAGADAAFILPDINPFDLERVEVLRGPQGTLWGVNSISGMVRYVLSKPDVERFSARTGADLISVNHSGDLGYSLRGSVNIPLIEGALALRASASRTENPGFIDNALTGEKDENRSVLDTGRIALLWKATDQLSVTLQALLQRTHTDQSSSVRLELLHDVGGYANAIGGLVNGELSNYHVLPDSLAADLKQVSLNINWDLDFARLISTSSYSRQTLHQTHDVTDYWRDGVVAPITGVTGGYSMQQVDADVRKFVQEIRLASPTDQRTEWMLGAFYDYDRVVPESFDYLAYDSDLQPIPGFANLLNFSRDPTSEELALFGNATYKITQRFDLTAGLRWAKNKQTYSEDGGGAFMDWCCGGPAGFLNPPAKSSNDVFSYAFSSRYRFNDNAMLYARVATGFRPGGPNVLSVDARLKSDAPGEYGPDRDINYEMGLKSDFFGQRLQVEAAVYRIDWKDIQVLAPFPGTDGQTYYTNVNAGRARSEGLELSVAVLPVKGLQVTTNLGYSKPRFLDDQPLSGYAQGDLIPGASQWTGSIAADYMVPVARNWTAALGGGLRYTGEYILQPDPGHVEDHRTPANALADLHLTLSNSSWRTAIYVRNLFDKRVYAAPSSNAYIATPAYGTYYYAKVNQPRTIGFSVDRKF